MLDWQNILVSLIVLAAVAYIARRGLQRLRSFRAGKGASASPCATGCGSCDESQEKRQPTPRTVFVEIGRSRTLPRRTTR
jgi:hypothetical protein